MNESNTDKPLEIYYGKRKTDILPGVIVDDMGRRCVKAAHYASMNIQIRKLSMLMDIAHSIMAEMDLTTLLQLVMKTVTQVMNADRFDR